MNESQPHTPRIGQTILGLSWQRKGLLIFAMILAALLLFLAIRMVSWQEVLQTLRQLQLKYIGFGFLFNSLALYLRGQRWGVLVRARKKARSLDLFFASAIGYLGNTFLPARAGELLRSFILGKETEISTSYVLATALTERVIDAVTLVLIGSLLIPMIALEIPTWIPITLKGIWLIALIAMIVLLLAPYLERPLQKLLSILPLSEKWQQIAANFLTQFLLGTKAFVHPLRSTFFLIFTTAIWLLDALGSIVFAHGLRLTINLSQALLLLSALGLSSTLPSTPGYIGIYQYVAVTVMPAFGITPSQALVYIFAGQAVNVISIVLWGLAGLGRFGIRLSKIPEIL